MAISNGQHQRGVAWHLAFMQSPQLWPRHPFLPVRNDRTIVNGLPAPGLLFDGRGKIGRADLQTTVFLVNLLDLGSVIRSLPEFLAQPHLTYGSWEELVAAGWRVD